MLAVTDTGTGIEKAHIAYLQKPITPEALITRVRGVLDGASSGGEGPATIARVDQA